MLSERITKLFHMLQCSNTDIARYAGCSQSNISRLKSGARMPGAESRTIRRLAEGVYRYADDENMLSVLSELCGLPDTREEVVVPAVLNWLYAENEYVPPHAVLPKSKRARELRRRSFGERLGNAMMLLGLTNGQLAAALNVDVSLISRYRSGIYHPGRNEPIKERLSDKLLTHAERIGRWRELAGLCGVEAGDLTPETLMEWLFGSAGERTPEMAEMLFRSIDMSMPDVSISPPELPSVPVRERYWGTDGLRKAVIRFLRDASREGGELLLYSDEPLDWMTKDRDFFALWSSQMEACVRNGIHIRIIHNVDRVDSEMITAINGWFPLYASNMIEPYVFRKLRDARFCHTVFLRPGRAGIVGAFPTESGEDRWYDYITDKDRLGAVKRSYDRMFADAAPLMKIYTADKADEFWSFCRKHRAEKLVTILYGLSIGTMPEGLLGRIIDRTGIAGNEREEILKLYEKRRLQMLDTLESGSVNEIICMPDRETVFDGQAGVNFGAEAISRTINYTAEEYAEHVAELRRLMAREKNYRLTLLPATPFRDLQIFTMKKVLVVLRCREPFAAFVFSSTVLTRSVSNYFDSLIVQYGADRSEVIRALEEMYG